MTHIQTVSPTSDEDGGRLLCYRAYQPSAEERALMRIQNALAFQQPSEVLAAYYTVWQQCRTLGHSPVIVEKKAVLAAEARRLLQAGEAPGGPRPDEETHQFRRFCRLFLARGGEQFPPFYDLFAQFWAGQDIVQVPGQPVKIINVLPQPVEPGFPALAWVLAAPLPRDSIVCAAWPIGFAGGARIPAGTLGRVEGWGGRAGNVLWEGHPHLVLCLREMLMMPRGPLPRKSRPTSVRAFFNKPGGSHEEDRENDGGEA